MQTLKARITKLKKQLQRELASLSEDNPKIKRLSSSCFTLRVSHLEDNWTPFYHDWGSQYAFIIDKVNSLPVEQAITFIKGIIDKGKYTHHYFAPEVRQKLQPLA